MKKNNLLLLSSLLLLASCGQVENPTSNESEQPSQIPPSEITPTEVPTSEVTPTEEVSSDIVEEDYIVDENGIKRYKFDESGYEEFTFFDEKASNGKSGVISFAKPRQCLRSESAQGGRNEYAWSRSDHVVLTLEKKSEKKDD